MINALLNCLIVYMVMVAVGMVALTGLTISEALNKPKQDVTAICDIKTGEVTVLKPVAENEILLETLHCLNVKQNG